MGNYFDIYTSSAELDNLADKMFIEYEQLKAKAKRLRWIGAPEWANCIAKPTKAGLRQEDYRRQFFSDIKRNPADPCSADDYRWADRDKFGWFNFDGCRSAAEAGNWVICEWREGALP